MFTVILLLVLALAVTACFAGPNIIAVAGGVAHQYREAVKELKPKKKTARDLMKQYLWGY